VILPEGTTSGWQFTNWLLNNAGDAGVGVRREDDFLPKFVMPLVPWLLVFLFIWFFVFRQLRRSMATQPKEQPPVRVIVVNDESKQ
jgi:hypothetical protein